MTAEEFNKSLKLISNNDKRGMEEIYNGYHDRLYHSAYIRFNNRQIAEDVVSNLLISIFKNADKYSHIENPDSWMFGALQFAIINYKKKNKKYVYTEDIDTSYHARNAKTEFKIELAHAVGKLSKRQCKIYELHFVFDIDIKETAEILGISISTVNREINVIKENLKYLINF